MVPERVRVPSTNWDIIKFKYEVMGLSLEAIAVDTGLDISLLRHNAKSWKQLSLVEDDGDRALTAAERASKIHSILKTSHLGPKYVELEMILLYKAIEISNNLTDSADNSNIVALKNLTDVLANLLAQNPALAQVRKDSEAFLPKENKWEINIINGGAQDKRVQTVEVKQ